MKTNKSDYIDAEAIAEAVQRPSMRLVPLKTEGQLDLQAMHRVRERWGLRRTAVIDQIRGLLLERGITFSSPGAAFTPAGDILAAFCMTTSIMGAEGLRHPFIQFDVCSPVSELAALESDGGSSTSGRTG